MANLQGFKRGALGHIIDHCTRHSGDPEQSKYRYGNISIDPERTHLNYSIFERRNPLKFVLDRADQMDIKPRKTTNLMSSWVVTLPKNVLLDGREREFFQTAYDFLADQVGQDNVVGAWVHLDETTPHMHFAFTPVTETVVTTNDKDRPLKWTKRDERANKQHKAGTPKRDRKGTPLYERVPVLDEHGRPVTKKSLAQAKMFDRLRLKGFHQELSDALEEHFGFETGVTLGDPGERELSRLGQSEYIAAKKTLAKQQREIADVTDELDKLLDRRAEIADMTAKESDRLEHLQRERKAAGERVAMLESVYEAACAADTAPLSEKGSRFDELAARCHGLLTRVLDGMTDAARRAFVAAHDAADAASHKLRIMFRRGSEGSATATRPVTPAFKPNARQRQLQDQKQPDRLPGA